MAKVLLEVCTGTIDEVKMAAEHGADRIELCAGLSAGGLTPSLGMVEEARCISPNLPIMAMVRSREGGFCYSAEEFKTMLRDSQHLITAGVDGIVFGFLHGDGRLDCERMRALVDIAGGKQTMLHRAFDSTPHFEETIDQLLELGVTRALTSGGAGKAHLGATRLASLRERAGESLEILPGGGILPENAKDLVKVSGCHQVHFAARKEGKTSYAGVIDMVPDPDILMGIREALSPVSV